MVKLRRGMNFMWQIGVTEVVLKLQVFEARNQHIFFFFGGGGCSFVINGYFLCWKKDPLKLINDDWCQHRRFKQTVVAVSIHKWIFG